MNINKWLLLALMLTFSAVFLVATGDVGAAIDGGYVGSSVCGTCHSSIKADFDKSGHPYKVRFTNGATPNPATDPLSALLIGYTPLLSTLSTATNDTLKIDDGTGRLAWSAVSYVIGGYGWKARWGILDGSDLDGDGVNDTGYVWTGSGAQYNMLADNYSAYNAGTDKKYSCAICHNTNGTSSVDAGCITPLGSGRTEPWASSGRDPVNHGGFYSEWTFSGVQCEACHGPGETHAGSPSASNIVKNTSKDVCGKCHIRSTNTNGFGGECGGDASAAILANGAQNNGGTTLANQLVQHHEQYNELVGYNGDGAHASLDCVTCHDPHKRSHKVTDAIAGALGITDNNLSAEARGAVVSCGKCHYGKDSDGAANIAGHSTLACIDCHMAEITKSATAKVGTWGVKGDVKGHIFRINPSATSMDRTNADGKHIATNYMTVNFACGKCHDPAVGTAIGVADAAAARAAATNYHSAIANVDGGYVGSNVCGTCHTGIKSDFDKSGHPYKVRMTAGAIPVPSTDPLSALLSDNMPLLAALYNVGDDDVKAGCGSTNLDWTCVDYVIGGYGWKARWGIKSSLNTCGAGNNEPCTGYVWSSGSSGSSGAQFNMLSADPTLDPAGKRPDWSSYGSASGKKYECAICHNTNGIVSTSGYSCRTDGGTNAAPARTEPWASNPGMGPEALSHGGFYSSWSLSGVQCEACHGAGLNHATAASAGNILKDRTKDACGKCHIRAENTSGASAECGGDSNPAILTNGAKISGNYIQHHEQYNELVGLNDGVHRGANCVDCHDPHKRSHKVTGAIATALGITDNNLSAEARGAVVSCTSCHGNKPMKYPGMAGLACIDCHMAEATQSATNETGAWGKMGDVKTHIFKIDPTATTITRSNGFTNVATNYITVDYACGKCHDNTMSTWTGATALTQADARTKAAGMHVQGPTVKFSWLPDIDTSLKINFFAQYSKCTAAPCTYDWDFGGTGTRTTDAGKDPDTQPSFTYSSAGTYTVTLTVTDDNGYTGKKTLPVVAVAKDDPPSIDTITQTVASPNVTLAFSGISADAAKIFIDWRDGTTSTITGPPFGDAVHDYSLGGTTSASGTYYIKVTVVDSKTFPTPGPDGILYTPDDGTITKDSQRETYNVTVVIP